MREREREDRQAGGERYDDAAKKEPGRRELRREPVEQVREEHEQLDVAPLLEVLEHAVRMRRCKAADGDEQPHREEGERQPAGGPRAMPVPQADRDARQDDEDDRIQDSDADDERVQPSPRSGGGRNRTLNTVLGVRVTIRS